MCKACKLDPKEVQRRYQRQGAVEVDDFEDEVPHRSSKKKKPKPRRKGCPENNGKGHVYIWEEVVETYQAWWGSVKPREYRYKQKICCGCLHVNNRVYPWSRNYNNIIT